MQILRRYQQEELSVPEQEDKEVARKIFDGIVDCVKRLHGVPGRDRLLAKAGITLSPDAQSCPTTAAVAAGGQITGNNVNDGEEQPATSATSKFLAMAFL